MSGPIASGYPCLNSRSRHRHGIAPALQHPNAPWYHTCGLAFPMVDLIKQFDYRYLVSEDESSRAAEIVSVLTDSGVDLLGFSEFPHSPGKMQVDLIAGDAGLLEETANDMGWKLSERKSGFLIQGDDRPNAIGLVLNLLADAHIRVTAVQAVSAGAGRFGALLWVERPELERASVVLHSSVSDPVDEASEESFPASDPPALVLPEVG